MTYFSSLRKNSSYYRRKLNKAYINIDKVWKRRILSANSHCYRCLRSKKAKVEMAPLLPSILQKMQDVLALTLVRNFQLVQIHKMFWFARLLSTTKVWR